MTVVYHGSKAKFDTFDYQTIGLNATSEGFGFYFTDSKQIAKGYGGEGYLYTVDFTGKKSLSSTTKTLTKAQLGKFLTRLDKTGQYLANFGDTAYEGLDKVLRKAVNSAYDINENDVEMIADICNVYGSKGEPLQELYALFGYDCIIVNAQWGKGPHTIYVALVHEAYTIIKVETL